MGNDKEQFTAANLISELDAGVFEAKLTQALKQTALAIRKHDNNKVKGEVNVQFKMQRVGDGIQVLVDHKIASASPTMRGKRTEEDTTQTLMYTSNEGAITITPDSQIPMFGEPSNQ